MFVVGCTGGRTFIPNGVNVVNSADLSKLRTPGSELKEALLPVNMVKASIGVAKGITVEPFWLLEFRRNELEPAGTYFSTNDFATRGGSQVMLGFELLALHKQHNGRTLGFRAFRRCRGANRLSMWASTSLPRSMASSPPMTSGFLPTLLATAKTQRCVVSLAPVFQIRGSARVGSCGNTPQWLTSTASTGVATTR